MTRREGMKGLLALAAAAYAPAGSLAAADAAIPPQGIGRRIRHLSYSDQGGRPDSVQVMLNRGHLYVGHMFSDGVTDPRRRRSAPAEAGRRSSPPATTRARITCRSPTICCCSPTAPTSSRCSRTTTCAAISRTRSPTASPTARSSAPGLSIHDISRPAEMREIAFLEMPGFGINRLWWTGGRYAYVSAHFDGFTDHILCIVDLQNDHEAGDRVALVAARHEPRGRRDADAARRASASRCTT